MIDLPENISDLFEESITNYYKVCKRVDDMIGRIENCQPDGFSWVTIDVSDNGLAMDWNTGISYDNNTEFRVEIKKFIDAFMSDELLNHYRYGRLSEISIVLGSRSPAGEDLNIDFDVKHKTKE